MNTHVVDQAKDLEEIKVKMKEYERLKNLGICISNLDYPLKLCAEMLYYCYLNNKKTDNMKASEIRTNLEIFFTKDVIEKAGKILIGEL